MLWLITSVWASTPDSTGLVFNQVLVDKRTRTIQSPTLACPTDSCERISLSSPNAMTNTLMTDTHWLAMMNDHQVNNPIVQADSDNISGRFLHHRSHNRELYLYVRAQQVQAFYWSWEFSTMQSNTSPFDQKRQQEWNQHIQEILAQCSTQSVLSYDDYGNRLTWHGQECGLFDIWIESHPSDEDALRIIGVRQ